MTSRRDLFKIAAGLGLTGIAPSIPERITAIHALEVPVSGSMVLDPATFADEAIDATGEHFGNDWYGAINAEAEAEWQAARTALLRSMPELKDVAFDHPFTLFEEASFNFVQIAYCAGVRHGAAFEHLRRTVIGDVSQCRTCWGVGLRKDGKVCQSCGGTGTVATGVQRGRFGGGD